MIVDSKIVGLVGGYLVFLNRYDSVTTLLYQKKLGTMNALYGLSMLKSQTLRWVPNSGLSPNGSDLNFEGMCDHCVVDSL